MKFSTIVAVASVAVTSVAASPFNLDQRDCSSPPLSGYNQTFSNLTGATQASDYLTYALVNTIDGKPH